MRSFKYIYLLPLLLTASACEDFLDIEPRGTPSTDQFYTHAAEMRYAVAAVYQVLQTSNFQKSEWLFGEATSDHANLTYVTAEGEDQKLANFSFTPENDWLKNRWQINYEGIFRANYVITELPKVYRDLEKYVAENELLPSRFLETFLELEQLFAEARFLRALYYFNLVKTYGGVPIMPDRLVINSDEHNFIQPRASEAEVYAYIERDLRESYIGLIKKDNTNIRNLGRVNKPAAIAYLMKVIGYQASPGILNDHSKWEEVVFLGSHFVNGTPMSAGNILRYETAYPDLDWESLMDSLLIRRTVTNRADGGEGPEVFFASQAAEFHVNSSYVRLPWAESEFGPESVFEINVVEIPAEISNINVGTSVWSALSGGNYTSGTFYNATDKLKNSRSDDPRLQYSIAATHMTWDILRQQRDLFNAGRNNNMIFKYHVRYDEQPASNNRCGRNIRLMRTAEVYLWYAEALNETGNSVDAIDLVNMIRIRANNIRNFSYGNLYQELNLSTANPLPMYPVGGYTITRDRIWAERGMELIYEWDRFWDIVRQGRAAQVIQENYNTDSSGSNSPKYFRAGVNERFAIPQEEIRKSDGVLVQNVGY